MWAINAAGNDADSDELLERMHAVDIHSAHLAMRDGLIHDLDAGLDDIARSAHARFGTGVGRNHLLQALIAATARSDGEYELRVDIFQTAADHDCRILIVGRERPTQLPDQRISLTVGHDAGGISAPSGANLCFVSKSRYVWPETALPRTLTAKIMSDRLRDTGYKSARLTVSVADLEAFDHVFLVTAFGPVPVESVNDQQYSPSRTDADILMSAFDTGPWTAPAAPGARTSGSVAH